MSKLSDFLNKGFQVGDKLGTVRALAANWLELDGASYLRTDYPLLEGYMDDPSLPFTTLSAQTLPTNQLWSSVDFDQAAGLFMAVGRGSTAAATSPDGAAWTTRTMPSTATWYDLATGNGITVATADSGTAGAYSLNGGVTWTAMSMPSSGQWCVGFGNGKFVAVKNGSNNAATSTDGFTWTPQTISASTSWLRVAYGGGVWVAIANSTTNATSPDGVTWTSQTFPAAGFDGLAYNAGVFCTVRFGSDEARTSPDGVTWTQRTLPSSTTWTTVSAGGNLFFAVSNTAVAATSANGTSWTAQTLPSTSTWTSATYGGASAYRFVVVSATNPNTKVAQSNALFDPLSFMIPNDPGVAPLVNYIRAA